MLYTLGPESAEPAGRTTWTFHVAKRHQPTTTSHVKESMVTILRALYFSGAQSYISILDQEPLVWSLVLMCPLHTYVHMLHMYDYSCIQAIHEQRTQTSILHENRTTSEVQVFRILDYSIPGKLVAAGSFSTGANFSRKAAS